MIEYPLFIPPASVIHAKGKDQTKKEARIYFDWLMSVRNERVRNLLNFLGEKEVDNPEVDLLRIGEKALEKLQQPEFSEYSAHDGEFDLTNQGASFVADIGLLIAELIQRHRPHIGWGIEKHKLITYNTPVLTGFPIMCPDPVGSAVAVAFSVLRGREKSNAWAGMFNKWMELTEETVPAEKAETP